MLIVGQPAAAASIINYIPVFWTFFGCVYRILSGIDEIIVLFFILGWRHLLHTVVFWVNNQITSSKEMSTKHTKLTRTNRFAFKLNYSYLGMANLVIQHISYPTATRKCRLHRRKHEEEIIKTIQATKAHRIKNNKTKEMWFKRRFIKSNGSTEVQGSFAMFSSDTGNSQ